VWQAQWRVARAIDSKLHVFKIGRYAKLQREQKAAANVASAIDPHFPHMALFPGTGGLKGRGLLRQEFLGQEDGEVINLRQWISLHATDGRQVRNMIDSLYGNRMQRWHVAGAEYKRHTVQLGDALDRWGTSNLGKAATEIGKTDLQRSLRALCGASLSSVEAKCDALRTRQETIVVGPVHGDLHAQNVLVTDDRLELIDFADADAERKWRLLDFLMLECSLKFLVAPPHARLSDLIDVEDRIESALVGGRGRVAPLRGRLYGSELEKIASGVVAIRRQALRTEAAEDGRQYRRGLVLMTAGLANLPAPINRVFLIHSLAWHANRVS
jgi:Ternary complex associated domain 9